MGATIRFEEIRGLYQPGHVDAAASGGRQIGCGYRDGYAAPDDRGRIFVNHIPRPAPSAPWQAARRKDAQFIDVTVTVAPQGGPALDLHRDTSGNTWAGPGTERP